MTVIAMTREMGSSGKDIAIGLAERLAMPLVHHNLVEQDVSELLHTELSDVHRHLEGKTSLLDRWKLPGKNLSNMTTCEVLALAEQDNVIVRGWGSTYLLRSVAHVLRVRVCAPLHIRVATLMERLNSDDENFIRQEILTNDVAHERLLKRMVRADWQDPLLYDLVINTERVSIEEAVELIEHTMQMSTFRATDESIAHLKLLRIEAQLHARIRADPVLSHHAAAINVDVNPVTHAVTLSGGVRQTAVRLRMKEIAEEISGVSSVVDNILLVRE